MKENYTSYSFNITLPYKTIPAGSVERNLDPTTAFEKYKNEWLSRISLFRRDLLFAVHMAKLAEDNGEKYELKYKEDDAYCTKMHIILPAYIYGMAILLYGAPDDFIEVRIL